jgi:glycerol-3-phosphate acyltransferase PlsY
VIAISYPITAGLFYWGHVPIFVFSFAVAATIFWSHRSNIGRLIKGEESTVTWGIFKDKPKPPPA